MEDFTFYSNDGVHKIHAVKWMPEDGEPKAALQLVHGMAEYIMRYADFAEYMAKHGFLVVGDDHLGHGGSVQAGDIKGYICDNDPATVLVADEHKLHQVIEGDYPGIPYFILGHSMGSFITRNYLCDYGREVQGAVIMGTGMQPRALLAASKCIAGIQKTFQGPKHVSRLIHKLGFGAYNKRIANPLTPNDWLSADAENVSRYNADTDCGFLFTVNGYEALFELISRLHDKSRLDKMPKELPMYFMSGADDPVGDYGKGVQAAVDSVVKAGMTNVKMKLYEGGRHEILNEVNRMETYEDVLRFFEGILHEENH